MRIGIDFDNTIINYNDCFTKQARRLGWIKTDTVKTKQQIRDAVRELPEGETKWRKLQGLVYGKFINDAKPFDGVFDFIRKCTSENIDVFIISHKTQYVQMSEEEINLREAAFGWLKRQGFMDPEGAGLEKGRIFFEHPRENKINRITDLKCTHFIDDLEEVFMEPQFPKDVTRILFSDQNNYSGENQLKVCRQWREIEEFIFQYV